MYTERPILPQFPERKLGVVSPPPLALLSSPRTPPGQALEEGGRQELGAGQGQPGDWQEGRRVEGETEALRPLGPGLCQLVAAPFGSGRQGCWAGVVCVSCAH